MASVAVVLGSIRPGRAGEQVVRWIEEQSLQVEGVPPVFIALRDYNLPLFAEEMPPSMQAPTLPEAVRQVSNCHMLVCAIVLIMVMLATTNPTLKGFFSRLFHRERADAPHAAAVKGGGKQ